MNHKIVGLFSLPFGADLLAGSRASLLHPVRLYRQAVCFKANPRAEGYMQALFAARYPEGLFVNVSKTPEWGALVSQADTIVLLYADAIGLGFGRIERQVKRLKKRWASIRVLNGRRRGFRLDFATSLGLRVRRQMEQWMVGEVAATVGFLVITPFLLFKDLMGGHR